MKHTEITTSGLAFTHITPKNSVRTSQLADVTISIRVTLYGRLHTVNVITRDTHKHNVSAKCKAY
jgi:Tfp pilus assembly protein PilO